MEQGIPLIIKQGSALTEKVWVSLAQILYIGDETPVTGIVQPYMYMHSIINSFENERFIFCHTFKHKEQRFSRNSYSVHSQKEILDDSNNIHNFNLWRKRHESHCNN